MTSLLKLQQPGGNPMERIELLRQLGEFDACIELISKTARRDSLLPDLQRAWAIAQDPGMKLVPAPVSRKASASVW